MKIKNLTLVLLVSILAAGQATYHLQYLTPGELIAVMDCQKVEGHNYLFFQGEDKIQLFFNESTNQVRLMGDDAALTAASDIIQFLDVAPRQFLIQVEIIEINNQTLDDMGIDWQRVLEEIPLSYHLDFDNDNQKDTYNTTNESGESQIRITSHDRDSNRSTFSVNNITPADFIRILKEKNLGTVTNSPRVVTTNNRLGTILDGQRTTYISRYSSYTNLFETQELTSGLSVEVTPSLGESGYISLDLTAKYTNLTGNLQGSPVESGQILKNHVYVKDNESFLLGAFKKTEDREVKRRVPVLGYILPFLFSNVQKVKVEKNILVVLTTKVIDLEGSAVPDPGE